MPATPDLIRGSAAGAVGAPARSRRRFGAAQRLPAPQTARAADCPRRSLPAPQPTPRLVLLPSRSCTHPRLAHTSPPAAPGRWPPSPLDAASGGPNRHFPRRAGEERETACTHSRVALPTHCAPLPVRWSTTALPKSLAFSVLPTDARDTLPHRVGYPKSRPTHRSRYYPTPRIPPPPQARQTLHRTPRSHIHPWPARLAGRPRPARRRHGGCLVRAGCAARRVFAERRMGWARPRALRLGGVERPAGAAQRPGVARGCRRRPSHRCRGCQYRCCQCRGYKCHHYPRQPLRDCTRPRVPLGRRGLGCHGAPMP